MHDIRYIHKARMSLTLNEIQCLEIGDTVKNAIVYLRLPYVNEQ